MNPLLSATTLEHWADARQAEDQLPLIIRRLLWATVNPIHIDFPSGDSINRPGFDGLLRTTDTAPLVPTGQSGWEMGRGNDPREKANEDYKGRTENPRGLDPRKTTFVFVTPRRWQGKEDWAKKKREEKVWQDVRVIDGVDLEQWLDRTPAVAAWARRLIVGAPDGVQDLDDLWQQWECRTQPPLTPGLLTAGRQQAVVRVRQWLEAPAALLRVRGDTTEEVLGFLAAVIRTLDEPNRERVLARSLVLSTPEAWRAVAGGNTPSFVIASTTNLGPERLAVTRGHHVVIPYGVDAGGVAVDITLPHFRRNDLEAALQEMGIERERCRALAGESRGRLLAVIDLLGGGVTLPVWAEPANAPQVVPFFLAGAWCQNTADLDAVARLARVDRDELSRRLARWSNEADPPIRLVGGQWEWVSRQRGWPHLGRFITAADLNVLRQVTVEVLTERDPRFDLPVDDRWRAATLGGTPGHSESLRRGLTEALAMLSAGADDLRAGVDVRGVAFRVIGEVFGTTPSPDRWCSLASILPLLAEALPDRFLELVERDVVNDAGVRTALFQEEGMFGGSRRCHLLWALETVAWSPDHLARTTEVLGGLVAYDPGGNSGNRPDGSLRAIFLPWRPHTAAPPRERLAALDALFRRYPDIAFRLCLRLLPHRHDTISPTSQPRWRSWAVCHSRDVPMPEYVECVTGLAERAVRWAAGSEPRWAALLNPIRDMPEEQFEVMFTQLEGLPLEEMARSSDGALRRAVRQILHHRMTITGIYPELTALHESRLRTVYDRLDPPDPVRRHVWLFDRSPQVLSVRGTDWRAEEEACRREQEQAVRALIADGLPDLLTRFAESAENSWLFGYLCGWVGIAEEVLIRHLSECLEFASEKLTDYARGIVTGCIGRGGWEWVDSVVAEQGVGSWPTSRLCRFAAALPYESDLWDRLERWSPDALAEYWRSHLGWVTDAQRDGPRAVRALLSHNRPFAAFEVVSRCTVRPSGDRAVDPPLLLEVVRAITSAATGATLADDRPETVGDGMGYRLSEVLGQLQAADAIDEGELVRIEWAWYEVLERSRRGPATLYRALARDPAFFAMLVGVIYPPRFPGREDEPPAEVDPAARSRASQAWRVLHEWHGLPGLSENGEFDEQALITWAEATRTALSTSGHAGFGDSALGDVLARTPPAPDGTWPTAGLARWIEGLHADDLDDGIVTGVLNSRGMTCRAPDAGGEQERQLVARYERWAEAAWATPRVARILRQVAEHYRDDARREDECRDLREYWR